MPKLTINGQECEVAEGATVLQAVEQMKIETPVFCYHNRLSIAGNCRMCLVSIDQSAKLAASCAMPVSEGMVVRTNTPEVEKARKGNLEFLLLNHPLDCPVCDQGGECDLQDITMAYGADRSRYTFPKRLVQDKELGPLIKTIMNRCIHCTRCVRFATEVAGVPELGTQGRGEHMEIMSYLGKALTSELSGNLVDLCPVGALTSKPHAFKGRPWELTHTESVDVMDAVGSNIRIDTRGPQIMRILPRLNDDVNEEWISDKTRHAHDGLRVQRLDRCYVRNVAGTLKPATWHEAFRMIADRFKALPRNQIAGLVGDLVDAEAMVVFKDLIGALGIASVDCRQDGAWFGQSRGDYLFNTTIAGLEQADFCLLIGTNPRYEAPLVNTRLRKSYVKTGLPVSVIGPETDLTYPATFYGNDLSLLSELFDEAHPLRQKLDAARYPVIILGMEALKSPLAPTIFNKTKHLAQLTGAVRADWNSLNVLHTAAARVGGLDLGLVPASGGRDTRGILEGCRTGEIQAIYLLGADELPMDALKDTFVIYQGHHGDAGATVADVILPGIAYTEKDGLYVNMEGRVQRGYRACPPPQVEPERIGAS